MRSWSVRMKAANCRGLPPPCGGEKNYGQRGGNQNASHDMVGQLARARVVRETGLL